MASLDDLFDPNRIRHRFDELQEFRTKEQETTQPRLTIQDHLDLFKIEAAPYLAQSPGLKLLFDEASRLIRRLIKLDPRLPEPSFASQDAEEEAAIEHAVSEAIAMPGGTPVDQCDQHQLLAMLEHTLNALEDLLEALSCTEAYPQSPAVSALSKRLGTVTPTTNESPPSP